MFSDLVVLYLFLGGTGAGLLVVLSVLELLKSGVLSRAGIQTRVVWMSRAFFRMAWSLSFIVLSTAILALLADLGRPDRLLAFVFHPRMSAMTLGAYTLAVAWALSVLFSLETLLDGISFPKRVRVIACVAGIVGGLVTSAYTGVLLQSSAAVLFWQTPFLPASYVLSSLSCGLALTMLVLSFTQERQPMERSIRIIMRMDSFLIIFETVAIFLLVARGFLTDGAEASAWSMVGGDHAFIFWGGLVAAGLIAPLMIENASLARDYRPQLQWASVLILFGGLVLRWSVVVAGNYDAAQTVQGILGAASVLP